MKELALAAALAGCVTVQPPPPATITGEVGESADHFIARILVDACTKRETTEDLVRDTMRARAQCPEEHRSDARCAWALCTWLHAQEDCAVTALQSAGLQDLARPEAPRKLQTELDEVIARKLVW